MEEFHCIWFGNGQHMEISANISYNWCPGLCYHYWSRQGINGTRIIQDIESRLARYCFKPLTIGATKRALKTFFKTMEPKPTLANRRTTEFLMRTMMNAQLRDDIDTQSLLGLCHSRHHFLVYCLLAKTTWSTQLAESMVEFLNLQALEILDNEKQEFLMEWWFGILELKGLISEYTTQDLLYTILEKGREFSKNRPGFKRIGPRAERILIQMLLDAQQRSFCRRMGRPKVPSLDDINGGTSIVRHPPRICGQGLDSQVGYNNFSDGNWTPSTTAPNQRPRPNVLNEVQRLQWQQEEMNAKLDHVDKKLDFLIG